MSEDVAMAVKAAEQRRCAAMLANDVPALDALIDERLHFSHATGAVDDKAAYLAKMAAGRITYRSIAWSEDRVIPLDHDAALLVGRMVNQVEVEGIAKRLDNRVITAWAKSGDAWRVVAFQSTPLKA